MKSPIARAIGKRATGFVALCCLLLLPAASGHGFGQRDLDEGREFEEIAELLRLSEGSRVADIGAGGGTWTMKLARQVGSRGQVFSTEVKEELVRALRSSIKARGFDNVTVISGTQEDPGLSRDCCEAVLLRLVYHAFKKPELLRGKLQQVVKPGGRILIIDFRPPAGRLVEEMRASGFTALRTIDRWRGQDGVYAVLFQR